MTSVPSIENIAAQPVAAKLAQKPRICMPTFRGFTRKAFRCGLYEAQDVLAETGDVDLLYLDMSWGHSWKKKWQKRILYHDLSRRLVFTNPGLKSVTLTREYDLFIAICQDFWDVPYFNAIDGWKEQCKTSVCFLDEIWASSIAGYKYFIHALRKFDYVFVGYRGSVGPLSKAIGRQCYWLPGGVDGLRFTPYPDHAVRAIDMYSMGRRWEGIHRALLEKARRREMFYIYDTFLTASDKDVSDHRQHRDLYANLAKRSQYFLVAPGKMNDLSETGGQAEVGYRYFEGAAAGTVMIGQRPQGDAFKELFPWPDAVIEIQPDGSDVLGVLANLSSEPARVAEIRRRNAAGALLHHDWIYRWKKMLQIAGMGPSAAMLAREEQLKILAERI